MTKSKQRSFEETFTVESLDNGFLVSRSNGFREAAESQETIKKILSDAMFEELEYAYGEKMIQFTIIVSVNPTQ
jgi:hypothetical protein